MQSACWWRRCFSWDFRAVWRWSLPPEQLMVSKTDLSAFFSTCAFVAFTDWRTLLLIFFVSLDPVCQSAACLWYQKCDAYHLFVKWIFTNYLRTCQKADPPNKTNLLLQSLQLVNLSCGYLQFVYFTVFWADYCFDAALRTIFIVCVWLRLNKWSLTMHMQTGHQSGSNVTNILIEKVMAR